MWEYCLVCRVVAEVLVAGKDVVHERRARPPVSENENRIVEQGAVGQHLAVALFLDGGKRREQAADGLCQAVLAPVGRIDITAFRDGLERMPVGADQCVDGEFVEFEKSHGSFQG